MNRSNGSKRLGKVLFFIPVVVILAIVVFGLASVLTVQSGTLIVRAESSSRYSPSIELHPEVTVDGMTRVAPFNLSLPQGEYTVMYGALNWYVTPPQKSILLSLGKSEFAVATYMPIIRVIGMTNGGFNSTHVTALHGVTPVVWVDDGASPVIIEVSTVGKVYLNPSQNYTLIFPAPGTYYFDIPNSGFSGTVQSL